MIHTSTIIHEVRLALYHAISEKSPLRTKIVSFVNRIFLSSN
jgi:hypothetical protein